MMGGTKRPPPRQLAAGQFTRERSDHADVEHLARVHRRQDRRQTLRQHGFTGTWRPDHQEVMPPCRRHFERPLARFLALDVPEIGQAFNFWRHLGR